MKTSPSDPKNFEPIDRVLDAHGIEIPEKTRLLLRHYFQELMQWNQRMDLTGLKDREAMAINHLGDTLTLLPLIDGMHGIRIMDIGSGAGVPGLILKILRPDVRMTLVDARRRRVSFLRFVISGLGLDGIEAIHARIEPEKPCANLLQAGYDIVISRAVTDILELARLVRPYLARQGILMAMKGPGGLEEIRALGPKLLHEGWALECVERTLPVSGAGRVIIVGRYAPH